MDFNNRGRCMRGGCQAGCTIFIPEPGPPSGHPGLVKCVVCSDVCVAAQHADLAQPGPPASQAPPAAPAAASATSNTLHGSRGGSGPFNTSPFRAHVQKRQEHIEAKLKDPSNSTPGNPFQKKFYPAEKSHLEGDLNPHNSKAKARKNKRKNEEADKPERPEKRRPGAKTTKTPPTKEYTVVLVEDTKAVARNKYYKPNATK
ncbi:hypothetical protein B0H11DRAFT_2248097 [Mycena galericulata]|nr:hypothetical protein B0H11DRAFT_2248097 [Mycena galericulata]